MTPFSSWPLWAKALALVAAIGMLGALWSCVASLVFLVGTGLLDTQRDVPLSQFWAYLRHHPDHPVVALWLRIAAGTATVFVVALVAALVVRRMRSGDRPLHGETGYAGEVEIRENGFRDASNSIHVGRTGRRYLTFGGPEHVALYAPTRSGKGVGVVIPNCLLWDGSLVVLDVKKENWAASAGIRAEAGQRVFLFDPLDPEGRTARYNPLSYVRRGTIDAFDDIQRIAQMLYPEATGDQEFWSNSARSAFIGVTSFLAETPELPLTLGEVLRMFTRRDLQGYLTGMIEARRLAGKPYTAATINALNDYLAGSADTVSGVRKSVTTKLVLWFNPRIDAATAESDFDLRRLRYNLHAIYVGVTPDNIDRLRPLLALFFQQVVDVTVKTLPQHDPAARHQVLMVLDEFPLLGAMPTLTSAFAFVAGYGVRMLLVLQSKAQMRAIYGADVAATVLDNCGAEAVFGTKDLTLTKELSERLGYDTVESLTRSGPRFGAWWKRDRQSQSASAQRRALMLPQEIARLGPHEEIILRAGMRPIRATRIRHYEEGRFTRLLRPAPVVPPITIDVRYDGGGTLPPEPAQPAAGPSAPAPAPVLPVEVQPHQADALWAAVAGAPVDLSDMGLDDGKAAVASLIAAVPTARKPAAPGAPVGDNVEGGRPKPRPRARKIG